MTTELFALGQRWISDSESELGIGTLVALEQRTLTLLFPASGEQRRYTQANAPVTRVLFSVGDSIESVDGWELTVTAIEEKEGLRTYIGTRKDDGETAELREPFIAHTLNVNRPQDRLFAGQVDRKERYDLRYACRQHMVNWQKSELRGMMGARIGLIPHQLYIAQEAGNRFAPRLLLADEVGLGKTIEAGLIIHQQLLTERAQRVLILVPETLQHQWLVEMLRRFNLPFSLFDSERIEEELQSYRNPFESEQLVLCSQKLLNKKAYLDAAVEAEWDLLVVDEAHHLTNEAGEPNRIYRTVETLAEKTPGLLLLTATPDQLGHESHFSRLRLLDPNRFHDFQQYQQEEQAFSQVADIAAAILDEQPLNDQQVVYLSDLIAERDIQPLLRCIQDTSLDAEARQQAKQELLDSLLDRHGTGRVMFRNTRSAIQGFPSRNLNPYPLEFPKQYDTALRVHATFNSQQTALQKLNARLHPEQIYQDFESGSASWWKFDPRIDWLIEALESHKQDKFLLICSQPRTVLELEEALRQRSGIRTTVFYEEMSILERDRAANYFADEDNGAQLLICSEIGSEGRNFQFARHLILFDLPLNPDLLEQRIGRLDRIGQQHTIQIHLPYFTETPQEKLFQWMDEGLNAFRQTLSVGQQVIDQFHQPLMEQLVESEPQPELWQNLLLSTRNLRNQLLANVEAGRDKLLELNSNGADKAAGLVQQLEQLDRDITLPQYMIRLWDIYGVHQEDRDSQSIILRPGEQMLAGDFPGLGDEGTTITFDREAALSREDVQYISWDHPMVSGGTEAVLGSDIGTTSVAVLNNRALPAGTFFLELMYVVDAVAPAGLQMGRFLPPTPVRVLLDAKSNNLSANVGFEQLNDQLQPIGRHTASKLVSALQNQVHPMLGKAQTYADSEATALVESARQTMQQKLDSELKRLQDLQAVNPNIREEELNFLREQRSQLHSAMDRYRVELDAIRLIVVSHG